MKMSKEKFNTTCIVTGKTDNLRMFAARNQKGDMVGFCFIHESVKTGLLEVDVKWKFKAKCEHEWKSVDLQYNGTTEVCQKCGAEN